MRFRNHTLNTIIWTPVFVLCLFTQTYAGSAADESRTEIPSGHAARGYAFFSPGALVYSGSIATMHFGAGAEALVYKGLGLGAEIGYLTPWRDISAGIGILSADGSYHFNRNRKASPFITGGYSLAFREGHANLINIGGGLNYWFNEKMGMRLEFRDHFNPHHSNYHYLSFRIGYAFR